MPDLLYPVIEGWHNHDPKTKDHPTDLDFSKIVMTDEQTATFNKYVLLYYRGGERGRHSHVHMHSALIPV